MNELEGYHTFRTSIIAAHETSSSHLRYLAASCGALAVVREAQSATVGPDLYRAMAVDPEIVLLDAACADESPNIVTLLRGRLPNAIIIAFGRFPGSDRRQEEAVDAILPLAATPDILVSTLKSALRCDAQNGFSGLYCFLPAKAGSGCSTVVLNTAAALVREFQKRVLLIDADLRSSILSAATGLMPPSGTEVVLDGVAEMSIESFRRQIVTWKGVQLLHAKRAIDRTPPSWADYITLLKLVTPHYDNVLVDLPELVNPATVEVVRSARKTFVVSTSELPALTLARQRLAELERLDLPDEHVQCLVNRWHRSDPRVDELTGLLAHSVSMVLPNDYSAVQSAIDSAAPVAPNSKLGAAFEEFAASLTETSTKRKGWLTGFLRMG